MRYLVILSLLLATQVNAANLFIDPFTGLHSDETWDGTNGHSYSSTATNAPASGTGYSTVQAAMSAMSEGDDLYLRGGEYDNAQLGTGTYNSLYLSTGQSGTAENYSSIQSFPDEWAILDGENNAAGGGSGRGLGVIASSSDGYHDTRYWKFERLEIKNGATGSGEAAGISMSYGPMIMRYCYIHDNIGTGGNNPAGLAGYILGDSIIEYNIFEDNGGTFDHNQCHIQFFSNYADVRNSIAISGFSDYASGYHVQRNEISYNYFVGSAVGIKTKGNQLFTGRSQDSGESGYSDTYNDRGNKYHHNIFANQTIVGISNKSDFAQIYNNIFDSSAAGIRVGYEGMMYKSVVYNNTIIDPSTSSDATAAIGVSANENNDYSITNPEISMYNYFYNNIIDSGLDISPRNEISFGQAYFAQISGLSLSNVEVKALYSYRPNGGDSDVISVYSYGGTTTNYTPSEWMTEYTSASVYTNAYDSDNLLYQGTTGADKYKITNTHLIDTGVYAHSGGANISHPYLSGVTIPSYIGAVDPDNDDWVDGVLDDLNVAYFTSATADSDPTWIEGATPSTSPTISITSPTTNSTYDNGDTSTITLSGTAEVGSDGTLSSVGWTCSTCTPTSGSATGTATWSTSSITLASGSNTIITTVTDSDAETGTDSIAVTYTPASAPSTITATGSFSGPIQ